MKKCICCVVVITVFLFGTMDANASAGALKGDSIKTCPNGKIYGYHGSDRHWHEAKKTNVKSGYSAIGPVLNGDPCPNGSNSSSGTNNIQNKNHSNSSNNQTNDTLNKSETSNGNNVNITNPTDDSETNTINNKENSVSNDTSIKRLLLIKKNWI